MNNQKQVRLVVAAATLSALLSGTAAAQSALSVSGQVDFGFRTYVDDGLYDGQSGSGAYFLLGGELNASMPIASGDVTLQFSALSDNKNGRSLINVKKAHYSQQFDTWDLLVGYNIENWGVAESQTVLNVLNPVNGTDVAFGADQLGTPMINANFDTSFGTLSAYALIGFEPNNSAHRSARHRGIWGTHNERATYQEGNGRNLDIALRFTNNYSLGDGSLDFAASYFNGTSREAVGLPGCGYPSGAVTEAVCDAINTAIVGLYESGFPAGSSGDAIWAFLAANATDPIISAASGIPSIGFVPYYQKIQHLGASVVYARGDLQLRFEGAYRKPEGEDGSFAAVAGGDYTWSNFAGTDGALTVALEYLYDDRNARQPMAIFENDLFLGVNYLLNDVRGTRFRAGGFYDLDSHAQLYQLSVSTRVNDHLRAEFSALHVETDGWNDPLAFIANDNYFELKLSAFF